MRVPAVLIPLTLLAGCSGGEPQAPASSQAADAAVATEPASPAPPAAKAYAVKEDTGLYTFEYSYPAEAAAIPALKAQLDAERDEARSELADLARDWQKEMKADGREPMPFDRSISWSVVTDLPGWLSLSGGAYEFTGGAHGNSSSFALLWDKAAGRRREPLALFVSKEAFDAALRDPYCALLNKERAKRREQPVDPNSGDEFDRCLDPSGVTVLLGSSDRKHFTRIGLIADPYAAGPYVEGEYEVTVPVTPALLKAVKPEYRSAFALGR